MDHIISDKQHQLNAYCPSDIAASIARNFKSRRLEVNMPQEELARRSGVSYGSLKRFESKHEISLKNLIQLSIVLNISGDLLDLFTERQYESINDVVRESEASYRKRARRKG